MNTANQSLTVSKPSLPPESDIRNAKILWLFNGIGTTTSLLYWGKILPKFLARFPRSEFVCARPPSKKIPDTNRSVECVGSLKIPLGRRRDSYDRQYVIASPTIISRIRRDKPDVIVVKELVAFAVYVAICRRWLGHTKVMALIEGDPYQGRTRRSHPLIRAIRRFTCRRLDLIMTNNEGGRRYLMEELDVPSEKIYVHPFLVSDVGAVTSAVAPADGAKSDAWSDLPEQLEPLRQRVVFLYVGQLIARKGVSHLVRAVSHLAPEVRKEVSVWLVGDGDERQTIESLAEELDVADSFRFVGRQPYERLASFYQAASVFVMPTLDDYRALVGFEAIAHGLPVLHSVHDGASLEVVAEGQNGFTFDPTDHQMAAERIGWFVEHRDRLADMGQCSAQIARRFTVENSISGLTEAIQRCQNSPCQNSPCQNSPR